jgi:hypothetical protein
MPPAWRIFAAFLVSPLVPSLLYASSTLFDGIPNGSYSDTATPIAVVAYATTLVFGLPTFLLLRRHIQPHFWVLVLAAGVVASAPWVLLVLGPQADLASIGSHVTAMDGRLTIWGWIEAGAFIGPIFALGMIAGAVFWLVAVFTPWARAPHVEVAP